MGEANQATYVLSRKKEESWQELCFLKKEKKQEGRSHLAPKGGAPTLDSAKKRRALPKIIGKGKSPVDLMGEGGGGGICGSKKEVSKAIRGGLKKQYERKSQL